MTSAGRQRSRRLRPQRLAESSGEDVDASGLGPAIRSARACRARLAQHSDAVRIVHDQRGLESAAQLHQLRQSATSLPC